MVSSGRGKYGGSSWSMADSAKKFKAWWIGGLIVAIGVLPMIMAWYLVNHPGLMGKPGNHGTLINPPRQVSYHLFQPLPELPSRPLQEIQGRWVLIHIIPQTCAQACEEALANTYKLHLLLNKDIPRVRRLAVWSDAAPPAVETLSVVGKDKDLYFATVSSSFLERLRQEIAKVPWRGDQVILMDPLGNLMMWYDSSFNPYGLYHDLQRLLRASRIG